MRRNRFDWLLVRVMRCVGIRSPDEYRQEARYHSDWPENPEEFCGKYWEGWDVLLATHVTRRFYPFDQLLIQVSKDKVDSREKYYQRCLECILWPMNPQTAYPNEWPGWNEFFQMASLIRLHEGNTNDDPVHLARIGARS